MMEDISIQTGDLIEYRDGSYTYHIKALTGVKRQKVRVESILNPQFKYWINVSMIVSVQRVIPGEGTVTVYQAVQ